MKKKVLSFSSSAVITLALFGLFLSVESSLNSKECSNKENEKIKACYENYFQSLNVNQGDKTYYRKLVEKVFTWSGIENLCYKFDAYLYNCVEPVKHCLSTKTISSFSNEESELLGNYHILDYLCGNEFNEIKEKYPCIQKIGKKCAINITDKKSFDESLIACRDKADIECKNKGGFYFTIIYAYLSCWDDTESKYCQHLRTIFQKDFSNYEDFIDTKTFINNKIVQLKSPDIDVQLDGIEEIEKFVAFYYNRPGAAFAESKIVDLLVQCLKRNDNDMMLYIYYIFHELANATSTQAKIIFDAGAVPYFLKTISSSDATSEKQLVSFSPILLNSIIKHGPSFRDYCINEGIIEAIVGFPNSIESEDTLRGLWGLVNSILKSKPLISIDIVEKLLPVLKKFIYHENFAAFANILGITKDYTANGIQLIIDYDFVEIFFHLVLNYDMDITTRELAILGINNVAKGTDAQLQYLFDGGVFKIMEMLFYDPDDYIRKNLHVFYHNAIERNNTKIHEIYDAGHFSLIFGHLNDPDIDVKLASMKTLFRIAEFGTPKYNEILLEMNLPFLACNLLEQFSSHPTIIDHTTKIIYIILWQIDYKNEVISSQTENCHHIFESLKNDKDFEIRNIVREILAKITYIGNDEANVVHQEL